MPDGNIFGISFSNCRNCEQLNIQDFPYETFKAVELSGYFFHNPLAINKFKIEYFDQVHFRDLMPRAVTREITEQAENIINGFRQQFRLIMEQAAQLDASSVCFDFGIERTFPNPVFDKKLTRFMKSLAYSICTGKPSMLLPVRIPFHSNANGEYYLNFLRNLVISNTAFSMDIHPHEMAGKELGLHNIFRWLRFDINLVRFIYEPEAGNRLVFKLLEPWLKFLSDIEYSGPVIFCPISGSHEIFEHEIFYLRDLCIELNQI